MRVGLVKIPSFDVFSACVFSPFFGDPPLTMSRKARTPLRWPPGIYSVCVYGGAPRGPQLRELRAGAHLVVGALGNPRWECWENFSRMMDFNGF